MPSIVSGPSGSPVLVAGNVDDPATAAVGATVETTAAIGVAVRGTVEATDPVGVAEAVEATAPVGVAEAALAGVAVGDAVGVAEGATVGVVWHGDEMNVSVSNVTAPLRASVLPLTVTPVVTVTDVSARIVPTKEEPVPRVAELLTCQKTLHWLAPLMSLTELADAVMRVEGALKIQTELGSFWPSSVRFPVKSVVRLPNVYTPPTRVKPPRAPTVDVDPLLAASTYALVRSSLACPATASPAWIVPPTIPGGNPVTDAAGASMPRSLLTVVGPVFVTVV